jgi:hypothetical protein
LPANTPVHTPEAAAAATAPEAAAAAEQSCAYGFPAFGSSPPLAIGNTIEVKPQVYLGLRW